MAMQPYMFNGDTNEYFRPTLQFGGSIAQRQYFMGVRRQKGSGDYKFINMVIQLVVLEILK